MSITKQNEFLMKLCEDWRNVKKLFFTVSCNAKNKEKVKVKVN